MRLPRLLGALGLALASALVVPALPVTPAPSASADPCAGPGGVTVVVDYNQLGGEMLLGCVANGGGRIARGVFKDAGANQVDARRTPGFVCRVNGKPTQAEDPCVNTPPPSAYWSLWWTDGTGGPWVYSSVGANSLKVPNGGYLAWSWQGQSAKSPPDHAPVARAGAPGNGTSDGDGNASGGGSNGGGGRDGGPGRSSGGAGSPGDGPSSDAPSVSPSDDPTASDGASDGPTAGSGAGGGKGGTKARGGKAGKNGKAGSKAKGKNGKNGRGRPGRGDRAGEGGGGGESVDSPLTDENGDAEQVSSASEEDPAGLPVWVPLAVLVLLAAGGVGSVVWRRRTHGGA